MDDRDFDYTSEMKNHYKDSDVAEEYHKSHKEDGPWRHRLIANRERTTVKSLLKEVPHQSALDIPTGTGKLAPVFAETGTSVLACDVSEAMLERAHREFSDNNVKNVRFQICDAEAITETVEEKFDVAVCLRLLHRVPTEKKRDILSELGEVADHVIASTAIESRYHQIRRRTRRRLTGENESRGNCYETPETTRRIFSERFEIVARRPVLKLLSQEYVYLLRPNQ